MAEYRQQAKLLLQKQLAELSKNPVEGFSAGLIDDNDIFKWEVSYWKNSNAPGHSPADRLT